MVNGTVITVENLGKKYQIRHQRTERYTAREKIATRAAALLRPLLTMLVFVFIFGRVARLPAEGCSSPRCSGRLLRRLARKARTRVLSTPL